MLETIAPFANHLPIRIRFGEGVFGDLPEILELEGATRTLVVVDEALADAPVLAPTLGALPGEVTIWRKAAAEPTTDDVAACAAAIEESGAEAIIAIGGGSTMDTAKAGRLVADTGQPYADFTGEVRPFRKLNRLLVTVPTTSGTGSEVSGGAVITDAATHRKAGIASPWMRADYALVDPALTYALPPKPTLYAGVDAVGQAISASLINVRTPIGTAIALEGVRLGRPALEAVVANPDDHAARTQLACASLMAGLAMNIADCGSEHSLGQSLGGRYGLPHGLTIGLILAESMDIDRRAVPELFERVADAMDEPDDGSGDGSRAVRGVQEMLRRIDLPTMRDCGVAQDDIPALARDALDDFFITLAPHPWTVEDAIACYEAAWAIERR